MTDHPVPEGLEASPGFIEKFRQIGPSFRWWAAGVGMIGSFATLLTSTIVNIAIPDIMGALGMTPDEAQWLATAFLAAGTVTMLITAWCIRAFGIAATYIVAMLVFIAGSFLGAAADTTEIMLIARVVQGAAAGVVTPIGMVVTAQVFPISQRGMAMGLMGVGTILAPALGPTMGGYLVDHLSWRWVFIAAVPFVAVSLPMAKSFFPAREESGPRPSFDWMGALLCSVFITALLVGLTEGQRHGWYHDPALLALAIGCAGFVLWVAWEVYTPEPILEPRLFLNGRFVAAAVVTFTVGVGLYGSTYVFPLFLQAVSRLVATEAGLLMAPAGLVMAVLFPLAGRLADLTSHRAMILIGLVLFALSNYPMMYADAFTPAMQLLLWYVVGRVGLAMIFPSLNAAAINPLPLALIPQGSGAINFMRQLGGAFGINLISLAMHERTVAYYDALNATQSWDNHTTRELMRLVIQEFQHLGLIGYRGFEASFGYILQIVGAQGTMLAYRDMFALIGAVFAISLLPALFIAGRRTAQSAGS
ncbi:MAG: DHA2 family efflux MFS transporter permease subunit [Gammaproteobacteria bacterium]|nr:DHA2 family efflux MFS transporter permease subunit [Gammaproteobacteria bacterium]